MCYQENNETFKLIFNNHDMCSIVCIAKMLDSEPCNEKGNPIINCWEPFRVIFVLCFLKGVISNEEEVYTFNSLCKRFQLKYTNFEYGEFVFHDVATNNSHGDECGNRRRLSMYYLPEIK